MSTLISCITPCHRVGDYDNLIGNFVRQSYPNRELIVVLDWGMPVIEGDRIRCVFIHRGASIGAKRNAAVNVSKGDIIAHLDSDDWYGSGWLDQMYSQLTAFGCNVTGLDTAIFDADGTEYVYEYEGVMPYVLGATMVYFRKAWETNQFKDISEGEDAHWLGGAGRCISAIRAPKVWDFRARITGDNTCSHKALKTMKLWQA